jgi:pimeloyl-ACP methyl ester carboxylesterase
VRFVLVHGGAHGAWCWDKLIPELHRLGHEAVAMDLPGHGEQRDEQATLAGYRDAIVDVLAPGNVLVGHSMGCCPATIAADAFPAIGHVVYIAGPIPVEGETIAFASGASGEADGGALMAKAEGAEQYIRLLDGGARFTFDPDDARRCFYHDCPDDVAAWAAERITPQQTAVLATEAVHVSTFWAADLPRSFIRCTDDRAFPARLSKGPVERLGVEEFTIASGHFPQLSRPADLAGLLLRALDTKPVGKLLPRWPA